VGENKELAERVMMLENENSRLKQVAKETVVAGAATTAAAAGAAAAAGGAGMRTPPPGAGAKAVGHLALVDSLLTSTLHTLCGIGGCLGGVQEVHYWVLGVCAV